MTGEYRLYQELAGWWPLISPPSGYADEAAYQAHAESEHFKTYAVGACFPRREFSERAMYETFDP